MDLWKILCLYIILMWEYIYADKNSVYTDMWAVHVEGGDHRAKRVAEKHGFVYIDKIMDDYYHFQHHHVSRRSTNPSQTHEKLSRDPEVLWLEQQIVKRRIKRDIHFNDPKWPRMWYLNRKDEPDMNVMPAWEKGYTGKNVVVSILDDGIEKDHPDLSKNYDANGSYDVNSHDPDPQPRYDFSNENRHGTRCAGEVAGVADNNICSVGVAYDAKIGGVRMLDGDVTDSVEATSLSLNRQHIDIYSASWGPDDDGRTVDGPATLARKSFYDGITKGRGGLGSIFVWASGNGGRDGDSCNCDGYTNSIYTLSISSATETGNIPWYSEACSSTLATTYSSGLGNEKQIITTDLRHGCTEGHTGTSASAPLAAGICALALQANPNLTWRDMQHIVVRTAKKTGLNARDWKANGVGRYVSHSYGYGLMDASAMVDLALNWTTVPPQHVCEIISHDTNRVIPQNGKIIVPLFSDGCKTTPNNHVHYLEHVQAKITLTSSRRGEIQIFLTSPMGTRSTLLAKRSRDTARDGFNEWAFMTTHTWGEIAKGTWTLEIENGASSSQLKSWTLVLRGTPAEDGNPNGNSMYKPGSNNHQQNEVPAAGVGSHAVGVATEPSVMLSGCAKSGLNGHCLECQQGYFLLDGSCLRKCPQGYYGTIESREIAGNEPTMTGICEKCAEGCSACHGPTVHDCFSCSTEWVMNGSSCVYTHYLKPQQVKFVMLAVAITVGAIVVTLVIVAAIMTYRHCRRNESVRDSLKVEYHGIPNGSNKNLLDSDSDSENEVVCVVTNSNGHAQF